MKKRIVKSVLAASMLFSVVLGQGVVANAAASTPSSSKVPIMTDNLFKYGLVKDVELPVTVTAGGLSYTLEKIMIYDVMSKDAQALIKKYGYTGSENSKYFIWTKITVENKSGHTVQQNIKDLSDKWELNFGGDYSARTTMPEKLVNEKNSKEAVWDWSLAPGNKMTTYQAYLYNGQFKSVVIWLDNKKDSATKYIVKNPEE